MTAPLHESALELHSRTNDGIRVRLLWDPTDGRVVVDVVDRRTGDAFRLEVEPDERALDVFQHPYAYAAWRRVDTRPPAGREPIAA